MKKFAAACCAASLALSLAACGASTSSSTAAPAADAPASAAAAPAEAPAETTGSALSGKVSLGGSTSMEKVAASLQEIFMEANPGVDVTYDPTGSGAGITGALEGTLDIGLSSRGLHDDETGITATTICLDGIAMVVNTENPVEDLTVEQIGQIFTGEITNWSELGGQDAEIVVIGREAGSGTRDGFESIVGVEDACVYVQELTATGAVISAVQSNAAAIGYASLSAVDDSVRTLTVGGVVCSEETVQDGSYPIQRPFNFVTNDAAPLSAAAQAFLDFAQSAEAAELIRNAGAVPMA